MFWISNVQNYIHDNVAVGGKAGFWTFTHTATTGTFLIFVYKFLTQNFLQKRTFLKTFKLMFTKRSQEIQCLVGEYGVIIKQEFKN